MKLTLCLAAMFIIYIVTLPLSCAAAPAGGKYLYAVAETDRAGDAAHSPTVTDLRLHGWRVGRHGALITLPHAPDLFANPLLARYRGKMYTRPYLQTASSGGYTALLVRAGRDFGYSQSAFFLYSVRRDGRLTLRRVASTATILPLVLRRQLTYFGDNGSRYFYKLAQLPSVYGAVYSQTLTTYRVEQGNRLTYQGRCFLPGYFTINLLSFAPDGRTAYLPEVQGYIYQLRVLPNGVLQNLHPGFLRFNLGWAHPAAAFSPDGNVAYFACNDYPTARNAHILPFRRDAQGQLSWCSPRYINSGGQAWAILPDAQGNVYTINGLGDSVVQFGVKRNDTLQIIRSYPVPSAARLDALVSVTE